LAHVGRPAQRHPVIVVERQQQHAQRAGPLRLGLSIQMKGLGGGRCRRRGLARLAVEAPRHGLQQLAGVLEIAAPQQGRAFACQAVSRVGGDAIIGNDHPLRRRRAALRMPAGVASLAVLAPRDEFVFRCHGYHRVTHHCMVRCHDHPVNFSGTGADSFQPLATGRRARIAVPQAPTFMG